MSLMSDSLFLECCFINIHIIWFECSTPAKTACRYQGGSWVAVFRYREGLRVSPNPNTTYSMFLKIVSPLPILISKLFLLAQQLGRKLEFVVPVFTEDQKNVKHASEHFAELAIV